MAITLTTKTIYIGNNVGGVINMPMDFDPAQIYLPYGCQNAADVAELFNMFDQFLKSDEVKKFNYLFAVTANKIQKQSAEILKNNGFRAVKEFYSAHFGSKENNETLTLFAKTQKDYLKTDLSQIIIKNYELNCSVSVNRGGALRCTITSQNPGETFEDLKGLNFSRIKNTPIWFRIDKDFVVEKQEIK